MASISYEIEQKKQRKLKKDAKERNIQNHVTTERKDTRKVGR